MKVTKLRPTSWRQIVESLLAWSYDGDHNVETEFEQYLKQRIVKDEIRMYQNLNKHGPMMWNAVKKVLLNSSSDMGESRWRMEQVNVHFI